MNFIFYKMDTQENVSSSSRYNMERIDPVESQSKRSDELKLVLTQEEKELLQIIDKNAIDTLVMSNDKVDQKNKEFLSKAETESLSSMLRLLFVKVNVIYLQAEIHVKIDSFSYIFESTELAIENHFDIAESIDMVFMMLLERVKMMMCSMGYIDINDFKFERLRANIRMNRDTSTNDMKKLSLPIKYRVKNAAYEINAEELKREHPKKECCDLDEITSIYMDYKSSGDKDHLLRLKGVNLYHFQWCRNSLEVNAVPLYLTSPIGVKANRNFIVLENVQGDFQRFMEISNTQRFERDDFPNFEANCIKCNTHYIELVKLDIHHSLDCGDRFEIYVVDNDYVEEDPNQFEIKTTFEKWMLFGVKNNTIKNF